MKDFDHASIVARYKSLQEKYPNEDPRILLKDIFSQNDLIQADFSEDITFTELGLKRTDPQKKGRWITTKAGNKVFIVDLDVRIAEQIEELEREKNNFILEDRQRLKRHINNLKNLKQIKNETFRNSAFNQEKKAIQSFLRISSEYHEKPLDKAKRLESEIKRIRQRIQEGYKENLTTFSKENQDSYKKKLKNLVEVYNKIPLDIRIEAQKKESTFTSLGLKRKADFSEDIVDKDKWKKTLQETQKTGDTLDMVLWEVAQDFEQVREDFLSLDAYAQSKIPGSKYERLPEYTRLQERQKQLQQYEKAYQSEVGKQIRAINPKMFMPSIESISIPFELTNSETGAVVQGSVLQSFEKNTKELTPVSSSNVRGVGQFGNELLVQFHPSKGTPMRTYRYMFDDPQQAAQAYQSLTNTGSPGRWVWQNLRGHIKGEPTGIKVVPHKYGPSLSPPGQGLPTIGGTTASLVDYEISNRTPTSRVANFDEMAKQMRRNNANPSTNPQTGSGIEALLGTREGIRELGLSPFKMGKQLSQLPDPYGKKRDFVILEEGDITKDYLVQGHWKQSKYGKRFWTNEYNRGEGINAFEKEWTPEEIKEWDEWERSIKERNELAKEGETINPQLPMSEHQKKAYLQYRDTKFFTKRNYRILDSLSDKLMISRAIDPIDIPLEDLNYIFYIDDCFKELPQSIQDSITEVRIYPKAYEDPLWGDESYSGISGFWVPSRKSVTIGMYKYFHSGSGFNLTESKSWLNEVLVHEGAHALDDTKLSQKEIKKKRELYRKYKGRLSRHYAGKNEDEFFAESFTYNYLVRNDKPMKSEHHEKLMETETDINFFINSIIDKYDFLRNLLWEKIEVLET